MIIPAQAGKVAILGAWDCGEVSGTVTGTLYEDGVFRVTGNGRMKDYYRLTYYDVYSKFNQSEEPPWGVYSKQINTIVIDDGITHLGGGLFYNLEGRITDLVLPETGLKSIGDCAFGALRISELRLPEGLECVGALAFDGSRIDKIKLPASLKNISTRAFEDSAPNSGQTIDVADDSVYFADFEGALYSADYSELLYNPVRNETCYIPSGVKEIGPYAFSCNKGIVTVICPDGLTKIGEGAFAECSKLSNIYIPCSLSSLARCSMLTDPFYGTKLTNLYYEGTMEQWSALYSGYEHQGVARCDAKMPKVATSVPSMSVTSKQLFLTENGGPSKWAAGEVDSAIERGIVPEEYQCKYKEVVSRLEAAELFLYVAPSLAEGLTEPVSFTDTNDQAAIKAGTTGLIIGNDKGEFMPSKSLTRVEFAMVCIRFARLCGVDTDSGQPNSFIDIPKWANESFDWLAEKGILRGTGGGKFEPDLILTREQLIVTIGRLVDACNSSV